MFTANLDVICPNASADAENVPALEYRPRVHMNQTVGVQTFGMLLGEPFSLEALWNAACSPASQMDNPTTTTQVTRRC